MTSRDHLLLFTRYPESGRSKTRLIPALGADGAARLQKLLTEKIALQAKILAASHDVHTVVHYSGGTRGKMASWLGALSFVPQPNGDLGLRMQAAFHHAFAAGARKAVLIGSDIPGIDSNLLAAAFIALDNTPAVIGPCQDGGYYLIGMCADVAEQLYPLLFTGITWSTAEVFANTSKRLAKANIPSTALPFLRDIDTPEDLDFARSLGLL